MEPIETTATKSYPKRILVIGGAGFVGSNLAFDLHEAGYNVVVMDNLVRRGGENNLPLFSFDGIEFVHGDIRNKEDFNGLGTFDVILNCAAQPSAINYANPTFDITNNTLGVLNILEFCRKTGAGLIQWSTNKVYTGEVCNLPEYIVDRKRYSWINTFYKELGDSWSAEWGFNEKLSLNGKDHSIYGVSKVMADLLIQEWSDAFGINSIVNRFSCLAGPNQWGKAEQGWVSWFAIANEFGLPIKVYGYDGNQVRDYLFIDDLSRLIRRQIEQIGLHQGSVFNVGGGKKFNTSINEAINLLMTINKAWGSITYLPDRRRADQAIYISDNRKVCETFGWEPKISLEEGFKQILDWVRINEQKLKGLYSE